MIDALLWALRKARHVPRGVWAGLALVVALAGLWRAHTAAVREAFAAGRYSVQTDAARVGLAQRETVTVVSARVDTVTRRVVQRVAVVESLIVAVPESIRVAVPAVDTALKACSALAQDCDRLRVLVGEERQAREALTTTLGATVTATSDSVRTLQQRPRWRTVLGLTTLAALGGWLGGRR